MFRRYRIWRAEKALAEARRAFSLFGKESGKSQQEMVDKIVSAKRDTDKDWSGAQGSDEVESHLYELFLHQQFMGYLAETIRQKASELYGLKNKLNALELLTSSKAQKLWIHREDLGSSAANSAQQVIYREFLANILPQLERVEVEIYGSPED